MFVKSYTRLFALLCVIFCLISSCSVQKKRYSRGYYVDFGTSKSHRTYKKDKNRNSQTAASSEKRTTPEVSATEPAPVVSASAENKTPGDLSGSISKERKSKITFTKREGPPDFNQKRESRSVVKKNTTVKKNNFFKRLQNDPDYRRKAAIITGLALLMMALFSGFAVPLLSGLFVSGDAALTGFNVLANFGKYMGSVIAWIGILLMDILVSLGVYRYYKKEKPKQAKLTSALRMVYSAILGAGIAQLLSVTRASSATAIYNHIQLFNKFWGLGLIVFGFHLISLGILYTNEGGKKWVNILIKSLLIIAGAGYIIQYVGILLVPNPVTFAAFVEPIFIVPMILGEPLYAIWKITKGGKKPLNK